MLILTRKCSETIVIDTPEGRRIEITLLGIRGNQARIGCDADRDVTIHRSEVAERIAKESA